MKRGILRILVLFLAVLGVWETADAQDPHYTQFYANQPMLNPAFTGAALGPRVSMNYRAQWVAIPGSFRQSAIGYDQPLFPGSRTLHGVGILIHNDRAGEGNLNKTYINGSYSFGVEFGSYKKRQYLRFGLAGGIEQANLDITKLRFGDQIDLRDGFVYYTNDYIADLGQTRYNPDVHFGVTYYNQYAWLGVSVHHLTEPNQAFISSVRNISTILPRRYTGSAGLRLPAGPVHDREKVIISPTVIFMNQRNFNQLNIGTYFEVSPMLFGLYWRTNYNNFQGKFIASDMIAGMVGFKEGIFSIGYSYDFTISKLTNGLSRGSHEIAIVMEFERDKKTVFKHKQTPCPRF